MDPSLIFDEDNYPYQAYSNNSAFSVTNGRSFDNGMAQMHQFDQFNPAMQVGGFPANELYQEPSFDNYLNFSPEPLGNHQQQLFLQNHNFRQDFQGKFMGNNNRVLPGSNASMVPSLERSMNVMNLNPQRFNNSPSQGFQNQMHNRPQNNNFSMPAGQGGRHMMSQSHQAKSPTPGTGGSNAQGRAINKMLLDILRERVVDPHRLALAIDSNIERMDCVNLATLLFHTGKKRMLLTPTFIKRIAARFAVLREELRAREASNALYGLKCMSSDCLEVRQLIFALANKVAHSTSDLVAQAVGNALYGCQMMTSDYEEVRYLLQVLAVKVGQCTELLEAQNVGNALYGLRGMNSDFKEVRNLLAGLTPKVATAREDLNGQALGNSLYGLQCMSSKEIEVRNMIAVLADKASRCWEDLKAQEVGNALYGLKRMSSDSAEVKLLLDALVPKIASSPEILDAQAIGNSFYGMQNMKSDNISVLNLLATMADKVNLSCAELDGQAMGNSLYGLQGMSTEFPEVRSVISALTVKIQASCLEMNAQELGNALYGLQNMTSDHIEVRRLLVALSQKVASSKHDLTSQEIGNALYGLQGMRSDVWETRLLVRQLAIKVSKSHSMLDPQGIANSLFGLQRMSSECEDVRILIHSLASKIEQSWKLMNPQHIAHSLFGLQNMSSFEVEVSFLIRALLPKIMSCRDEVSMKQMSVALYGLQSMYSQHEDIRGLAKCLAEKIIASKDVMTGQQLAASLYGLQGFDDSTAEIRLLIAALAEKAATVVEIDAVSLGNCFFGLQRMSSKSPEMITLLHVLASHVVGSASLSIPLKSNDFSASVCANIIYGIQNCSCEVESVRHILYTVCNRVTELISTFNSFPSAPKHVIGSRLPIKLSEVLSLYQSLTLSLLNLPGLDMDPTLRDTLLQQQALMTDIVESRKHEYKAAPMSGLDSRLIDGLTALLGKEPYQVTSGELLCGFECSVVVTLKLGVRLTTSAGVEWNPVLNVEVLDSSHTFPAKDLYTRLRNRFLYEQKNVVVEMVHSAVLSGQGLTRSSIVDVIRNHDHMLVSLFPPSNEDAAAFTKQLLSQGFTVAPMGFMSTIHSLQVDNFIPPTAIDSVSEGSGSSVSEFSDENFGAEAVADLNPAARGMNMHWLGEVPKFANPTANAVSSTSPVVASAVASGSGGVAMGGNGNVRMQGMQTLPQQTQQAQQQQVPQANNNGAAFVGNFNRMGSFTQVNNVNMMSVVGNPNLMVSGMRPNNSNINSNNNGNDDDFLGSNGNGVIANRMPSMVAPSVLMNPNTMNNMNTNNINNINNLNRSAVSFEYGLGQFHDMVSEDNRLKQPPLMNRMSRVPQSMASFPSEDEHSSHSLEFNLAALKNSSSSSLGMNGTGNANIGTGLSIMNSNSNNNTNNNTSNGILQFRDSNSNDLSVTTHDALSPIDDTIDDVLPATSANNNTGNALNNPNNPNNPNSEPSENEIALLEARLEIARIEARLLQLKKNKSSPQSLSTSLSPDSMTIGSPGTL